MMPRVAVVGLCLLAGCVSQPSATVPRPSAPPPSRPVPVESVSPSASAPEVAPAPAPAGPPLVTPLPRPMSPIRIVPEPTVPPAVQALLATAQRQQEQGDAAAAAQSFERALRIAPRSAVIYQRYAELRLQQKQWPGAEQLARKGLQFAGPLHRQQALWRVVALAADKQGKGVVAAQARERLDALSQYQMPVMP